MLNHEKIKELYSKVLPSNNECSSEKKKNIFIVFKKMVKEGFIKKGEPLSEIVEELMFIGEEMKRKKDIIHAKEELMNEVNDFVKVTKEKGFKEENTKNKDLIVADFFLFIWKDICKEKVYFLFIF